MHIEVLQEHLLSALNQLQKIVPTKPQLPILSSVLVSVQSNSIQFSATDLFIGMQTTVLGKVISEGEIAVPGKVLRDYIATLPAGKVTLELTDTTLTIISGKTNTTIQCVNPEEFPEFPVITGTEQQLQNTVLEEVETYVRFAASLDPTRPVLTTLLFQFKDDGLEIVSTDGFRLTTLELSLPQALTNTHLLLPAKAMSEVYRISAQLQEKTLSFIFDPEMKQVLFSMGGTKMVVRLIEGEYPPYQKIIPSSFSTVVVVDGKELEEELKRALIFSRDTANIIKFSLLEKELHISATSPAFGTYQGLVELEKKQGGEGIIAFNARYILDFLTTVKPERVEFSMNESLTPAQFRPVDKTEYRYIVMPFRVNE